MVVICDDLDEEPASGKCPGILDGRILAPACW